MKPLFPCIMVTAFSASLGSAVLAAPPILSPLPAELKALRPISVLPANIAAAVELKDVSGNAQPAKIERLQTPNSPPAFRVETFSKNQNSYAVEALIRNTQPVKKGDICLARFTVRALNARQESGEALFDCYFQQTSAPYTKSFKITLAAGADGTTYNLPFEASVDAPAGSHALYLSFGSLPQAVEIGDVQVLNFGRSTTIDKLPMTRFTYSGRDENAAWRTKALERIEQIRTAPIKIQVQDNTGKPVPGAKLDIRLVQPAFAFGTAVESDLIASNTPEAALYRDKVAELFDTVTIGNGLKWPRWQSQARREETLKALDWLESKHLRVRGHNLVWPAWQFSPRRLQNLPNLEVSLPQEIESHIEDVVTATKGRTWAWDVLNEPVHERDYYKYFPDTKSADWFKEARRLDPNSLLFVNEYAMLNSRTSPDFIKRYLDFIAMLKANGAPLDGIGVQGHIGQQVRNPVDVLSDLDMLQTAGLPIQITEFDINTKDEELQADYTRDFLIACYSHPAVQGFIMWGFWQPTHWKPDAAMFRADWSEKPNAKVWREWVLGKWRTHVAATTDAQGQTATRGHLGVYQVTVTNGNTKQDYSFQLTQGRDEVHLTIP